MKLSLITALSISLSCVPGLSYAYPSAVVFSPTGETRSQGSVGVLAYTSTNLSPGVSASSSWFGVQTGLLPQWGLGDSGVSFGGLEVGFDIITPFGVSTVKPVLNAKLGALTEGVYSPSVSIGIMEISPGLPSMNFVYVSGTKTLRSNPDTFSYGRLTLGYGYNAGSKSQFNGTFPTKDTRGAFILAYESPVFNRFGVVIDYFGGSSEVSNTYLGVVFAPSSTTTLAAGAFLANDRSAANDGFFAYLTQSFDIGK